MATPKILFTIFSLLILTTFPYNVTPINITEILVSDPNFSDFNTYLTRTKLDNEINSRKTITVLAIPNAAMSSLASNPMPAIKNILSLHILFDYYDESKLRHIADGLTTTTTLYQTTGFAEDDTGRVNITVGKNGDVFFGSAQAGSKPGPKYVKQIRTIPFDISVLEIDSPIIVPTLLTSGQPNINITAVMEKAGCKTFASFISSSGIEKSYRSLLSSGLTVFVPNDDAFRAKGTPDWEKLSNAELVSLLQYHALDSYAPISTLKMSKGDLKTLAPAGKYGLTASFIGDDGTLHTGIVDSKILATVVDGTPVVIYTVDTVLLPVELFGNSSSPAPAIAPATGIHAPSKAPSPSKPDQSPRVSPYASSPAPLTTVTPANPPNPDDGGDAPKNSDDDNQKSGGAAKGNAALLVVVVVSVVSGVISFLI